MSHFARAFGAGLFVIGLLCTGAVCGFSQLPLFTSLSAATLRPSRASLSDEAERTRLAEIAAQISPLKRHDATAVDGGMPALMDRAALLSRAITDDGHRKAAISNGLLGVAPAAAFAHPFVSTPQESVPWDPAKQSRPTSPDRATTRLAPSVTRTVAHNHTSRKVPSYVTAGTPIYTGYNRYWQYHGGTVPGVAGYSVNVGGAQNLLLSVTDLNIPNKGVPLAFVRTYNSQSTHDYAGTDQSTISNYGDGWTNTFDAHVAYNSGNSYGNGVTVYDGSGARYDYLPNAQFNSTYTYQPPPGMAGTVVGVSGNFLCWVKKSGTQYCFYKPDYDSSIPNTAGYDGRLNVIYGRNSNDNLKFAYAFDASPNISTQLKTVTVTTEASVAATLAFSDVQLYGIGVRRLLTSLTRPDGVAIGYAYDSNGNLSEVASPTNSAAQSTCVGGVKTCELSGYVYAASSHTLGAVYSPRQYAGDYAYSSVSFGYANGTQSVNAVASNGIINPSINDGYSSGVLQSSGPSGSTQFRRTSFSVSGSAITVSDTDLHQTIYDADPAGSGTIVGQSDYVSSSTQLSQTFTYDQNLDLASQTDPRKFTTNYLYDSNGNLVANASPAATSGSFRPTALTSYDTHNNVIAACEPTFVHSLGLDWTGTGPTASDSLCPSQSGATLSKWTTSSSNINGYITSLTDPTGYLTSYSYSTSDEGGGDYSLPTSITGAYVTQSDGTTFTPTVNTTYTASGLIATTSNGTGTSSISYDNLNRPSKHTDPDGVANYSYYYPNNQIQETQTPIQHTLDAGASPSSTSMGHYISYDSDGNEIAETSHFNCVAAGCSAGIMTKWYDGDDRLIEVALPQDANVDAGTRAPTRYFYDLSQGGSNLTVGNSIAFSAHGELYKTQAYYNTDGSLSWNDIGGTAYDAIDRPVQSFAYSPSNTAIQSSQTIYDSAGLGLIASGSNPLGEKSNFTYDNIGRVTTLYYSGDGGVTPARMYNYDANGRTLSITAPYGSEVYQYDADGRLTSKAEGGGGGATAPATLLYDYLANGSRKDLRVQSAPAPLSGTQTLLSYLYRGDGLLKSITMVPYDEIFRWTYTNAGRKLTQSDPYLGTSLNGQSGYGAATIASDTFTYSGGLVSKRTLPEGTTESAFKYDAEDEPASFSIAWSTRFGTNSFYTSSGFSYTARGQLQNQSPDTADSDKYVRDIPISTNTTSSSTGYDPTTGAVVLTGIPGNSSRCAVNEVYGFDNAGRRISQTQVMPAATNCPASSNSFGTSTYDAEDRPLDIVTGPQGIGGTYKWGVNNHPMVTAAGFTLHWDGDQLLYVTDSSGNLVEFLIGQDGVLFVNGAQTVMNVGIRDGSLRILSYNSSNGISGPNAGASNYSPKGFAIQNLDPGNAQAGLWAGTGQVVVDNQRSDQLGFGVNNSGGVIAGTRAYDPGTSQWTSADSSPGDVDNPASQMRYEWSGDNPVTMGDDSGRSDCHDRAQVGTNGGGWGPWHIYDTFTCVNSSGPNTGSPNGNQPAQQFPLRTIGSVTYHPHPRRDCPPIPLAPPNAPSVHTMTNIGSRMMVAYGSIVASAWFAATVNKGGPWDFKQQSTPGKDYDAFGNFVYGAVGSDMGFPNQVLLRMAGVAQYKDGTWNSGLGTPWGAPPYGDDRPGQVEIGQGISYAKNGC